MFSASAVQSQAASTIQSQGSVVKSEQSSNTMYGVGALVAAVAAIVLSEWIVPMLIGAGVISSMISPLLVLPVCAIALYLAVKSMSSSSTSSFSSHIGSRSYSPINPRMSPPDPRYTGPRVNGAQRESHNHRIVVGGQSIPPMAQCTRSEHVILRVAQNPQEYFYAPRRFQDNNDVLREAVANSQNRTHVANVLKISPLALIHLHESLKRDVDLLIEGVIRDEDALDMVVREIREEVELRLEQIKTETRDQIESQQSFAEVLTYYGSTDFPEGLKKNRDFMLAMVKYVWQTYRENLLPHVEKDLIEDTDFVIEALNIETRGFYRSLPESMRNKAEIKWYAYVHCPEQLDAALRGQLMAEKDRLVRELQDCTCSADVRRIMEAGDGIGKYLVHDEDVGRLALEKSHGDPQVFCLFGEKLRGNKEFATFAIGMNGLNILHTPFTNDLELGLLATRRNIFVYDYLSLDVRDAEEFNRRVSTDDLKREKIRIVQEGTLRYNAGEHAAEGGDGFVVYKYLPVDLCMELASWPEQYRRDKEFMTDVVYEMREVDARGIEVLEYAGSRLRADQEFVIATITRNASNIYHANPELKDNLPFAKIAVAEKPETRMWFNADIRNHPEVLALVRADA